ncbi:hypothetical protein PIROE2DRAFT_12215, partial [Piromyces sp. E2]
MITTQDLSDNTSKDNKNTNIKISFSEKNEETNVNEFWNNNSLASVYKKSNIISKGDLEKKEESENIRKAREFERNNNTKLHNALVENFKNESADINRLLISRKIITESKEEMGEKNEKYVLPKNKSKKEYQDDMEKTYYGPNESLIFRNNYEIISINNEDDTIKQLNYDNIKLNFDEELKINEKYSQLLLNMKNLDTSKDFYNIFTEQEINEKVQKIVAKVIPEESKKFKTSLPLFDALEAIEKTKSNYGSLINKLNDINDIYEHWVE